DTMRQEALAAQTGSTAVMTRLAEVIMILALRTWLEQASRASGVASALRDPQIGRAIAELHRHPDRPWTVDCLARLARLSRSRFSERFAAAMGTGPMKYVTHVRMERARELLISDGLTIGELALAFAYESEAAFARAFKRHFGDPPGTLRRAAC